jgi:ATP-dependent Zn protease
MIVKYGMDKDIGPISYVERHDDEYRMFKTYSEKTAQIIDEKIKKYVADCYEQSKKIIIKNKQLIEKLSIVLLDKEYLTKEEFESMVTNFTKLKSKSSKFKA